MNNDKKKGLWSEEEIDFLVKNVHLKDKDLAKLLKRSIHSTRAKRRQYYIKRNASILYRINMEFFKHWSKEMAYVLGFIYADGSIRIRKAGSSLKIKIKDKKLLEKMNGVMSSNYPIKSELTPTGNIYFLTIGRKEIVQDLIKLGVTPKKSFTMQFPDIPTHLMFHFIRGYFDGDGNTGIYNNFLIIEFTSGSKDFLVELKDSCGKYGIKCSFYKSNRRSTYYTLKIRSISRQDFFKLLYENASIYLERKYKIMQYYFKTIYPKINLIKCKDCEVEFHRNKNHQKRCSKCQSMANKERYMRYYYKKKKLNKDKMKYSLLHI